jgi:hypothetical protein
MAVVPSSIVTVVRFVQPKNHCPTQAVLPTTELVTDAGIVTEVKPVQFSNARYPIAVKPLGNCKLVKLVQPLKALFPIDVTPFIVGSDCNCLQPSNASLPIAVTLSGNCMLVKLVQPLNAEAPIDVTVFGIVTVVSAVAFSNTEGSTVVAPVSIVAVVRLVQPMNHCPTHAVLPTTEVVTDAGIVTEVKPVQFSNARYPIAVKLLGNCRLVKPIQF